MLQDFVSNLIMTYNGHLSWRGVIGAITLVILGSLVLLALKMFIYWMITQLGFLFVKEEVVQGKIIRKFCSSKNLPENPNFYTAKNMPSILTSSDDGKLFIVEVELPKNQKVSAEVKEASFNKFKIGRRIKVSYKISKWVHYLKVTKLA